MADTVKPKQRLLEPSTIALPPKGFRPCKAGIEAEYGMPGASMDMVRNAFFRPFNIEREDPESRNDVTLRCNLPCLPPR